MAFCINKVSCRMLRFTLLFVLMLFQTHLALYLPRLGKSKLVYMLPMHLLLHLACVTFCLIYSSWCQGLAVTCDCGAPWTLLLFFWHSWYVFSPVSRSWQRFWFWLSKQLYAQIFAVPVSQWRGGKCSVRPVWLCSKCMFLFFALVVSLCL